MTVFLEIDPNFDKSSDLPDFNQCVQAVLKQQELILEFDVTIALVDNDRIHQLNLKFLDQDKPTDVLAFPAGHYDPDTSHQNLGDIIISYPRAAEQAQASGHTVLSELSLLTVHGVLHLLGFDHDNQASENEMWQAQSEILGTLDIEVNSPNFSTKTKSN
jgi:probable rRNA maturation factor